LVVVYLVNWKVCSTLTHWHWNSLYLHSWASMLVSESWCSSCIQY
jgi:hypothetical protein